eukprot:3148252-Prymnesium_polylepis.2
MMHTPLYSPTDEGICAGLCRWSTAPSCVSGSTSSLAYEIGRAHAKRRLFTLKSRRSAFAWFAQH